MQDGITRRGTFGALVSGLVPVCPGGSGEGPDQTGSVSTLSTVQTAINAIKATGKPGGVALPNGRLSGSAPLALTGDYHGGIELYARGAEIVSLHANASLILGEYKNPGPEYRLNARISGINLTGPKKTPGSVGASINETADVFLQNGTYRGFQYAIKSTGGLIWDAYNLTLRDSGYGLYATATKNFSPNSINLYSVRIINNEIAIYTNGNPNGIINFWGGEVEGNNVNNDHGREVKIVAHDVAGSVNYFGAHFESNPGKYNLYYNGSDATKNLLLAGCQVISGAAEQVHIERGQGTFVASRITSGGKLGLVFGAAASGSVIDCEADISGPGAANVVVLRNGRIAFGSNPVTRTPLISATPAALAGASGIAAQWQSDTVQLRFLNAAGALSGFLQATTGDHALHNSNRGGGWVIAAGDKAVLRVGRGGAQTIEGGRANATYCGSASVPWAGGYTQTAFSVTSDRRAKRDIRPLNERERAVAIRCKALLRAFRLKTEVEKFGVNAVTHYGIIAQELLDAFAAEGLDALKTGILRHDQWRDQPEVRDENGDIVLPSSSSGDIYTVNYEELLVFIMSSL